MVLFMEQEDDALMLPDNSLEPRIGEKMNKDCYLICMFILVVIVIAVLLPREAWAQGPSHLKLEQAHQAAKRRMQIEINAGHAPHWADGDLADPIVLYDLSNTISGYLFPVVRSNEPAGYLTVAAIAIPNPVLEFATNGPSPLSPDLINVQGRVESLGYELLNQRPLYLGLTGYAYELTSAPETRRIIFMITGEIAQVDSNQTKLPLINLVEPSSENSVGIATPLAYKLISGVPDWNQFWGSYGCLSGCSPTAATNAIAYWDNHGYDNIIYGGDWQGAVNEMRTYMGTWCTPDGYGATYRHMVSPSIIEYTQAHGYHFESHYWCGGCSVQPTYANYRSEINANHPMVVCVSDHWKYGGHCMTGVGYNTNGNYMIVHDNWGSTEENVSVQHGSGYSDIGMISAAPDNTPPSKASSVQPNGWTGPYTSDTTPSFRWNSASDSGSGIAGYYVAVDDWTPEGEYGNDWWAGNVTVFTVPDAQSDGEHIFAVTSKDKAGNINPKNTNQQGDAPYYTFYIDTTAPTNPTAAISGCGAQDGVWQQDCTDPAFTWSGANDLGGSGIQDYHIYWGTDPSGLPDVWRSTDSYNPGTIDTSGGVVTYYLRISTRDKLGHESVPETVFTLRYDGSTPTANPLVAAGAEIVHSLQVSVEPHAQDTGSGLEIIHLSNNGFAWHSEPYATSTTWTLEPLNRGMQVMYLEVEDRVGNRSSRYPCWVCVDLYPAHPSSEGYRLWSAGSVIAGNQASSSKYRLSSTAGQSAMGGSLDSVNYRLRSGFQALWPADPGAEMFTSFSCQYHIYIPVTLREN